MMYVTGREARWTSECNEALCRPRAEEVWHYITLRTRRITGSSVTFTLKLIFQVWVKMVVSFIKNRGNYFTKEPLNTISHGKLKSSRSTPFNPEAYIEVTQSL